MTKIIAELCQNHQGDRRILGKMIKEAAKNGADYIKIQSIFVEDLTKRDRFENGEKDKKENLLAIKRPFTPERKRLSSLELSLEDHKWFIDKCIALNVIPITTIFSRRRVEEIGELAWPERVVKIASYDCASYPMLRELAGFFDHFIISTGAMYDHEIKKAAKLMNDLGKKVTFLHCMTAYPNELNMCNLNRMNWLREIVDSVGWSDHTNVLKDDILASMIAIYSGADFIERHFTILDHSETKDGIVSISPSMLERLSRFRTMGKTEQGEEIKKIISNLRPILGESKRNLTNTELLNRDYYRGRFASINKGKIVYNWEEKDLPSTYNE